MKKKHVETLQYPVTRNTRFMTQYGSIVYNRDGDVLSRIMPYTSNLRCKQYMPFKAYSYSLAITRNLRCMPLKRPTA